MKRFLATTILLLALMVAAMRCHATMTDDWRLAQLVPAADPARARTVRFAVATFKQPTPFPEFPAGTQFNVAELTAAYPQNYTATLEPGTLTGWELELSTNLVTWRTVALVQGTNNVTVRVAANPAYWRARVR